MEGAFNNAMLLPFSYTFTPGTSSTNVTDSVTSPWMDTRIWSKLPQTLIDRVLAFLPPPAFFRARCVCKRWYGLLFSNDFLELYIQISPRRHWFLFFKHKSLKSYIYRNNNSTSDSGGRTMTANICEGYIFDPYDIGWYRISFSFVPSGFSPAAASGGLICWVSDEAGAKSIILCNPLIGSLSQLPPTIRPRLFPSIGLKVGPSSIDVAVAGDDLISPYAVKNLSTESFHIDSGGFYSLWGTTSSLPRLCSLESGQMVCVDDRFYSMNYNPFSVLSYEIAANSWCKIQAPMRRFLRSPRLVESMGKLILVAAVEKSKLNVPKSLRLWRLQPCGTTWIEIERMPQQLYLQFAELGGGDGFDCVGHGEFIAIIIRGSIKVLLFDILRKMWQWIHPCSCIDGVGDDDDDELHGFAYEPTVTTPVTGLLDQITIPIFQSFTG